MTAPIRAEHLQEMMQIQFGTLDNWVCIISVKEDHGRIIMEVAKHPAIAPLRMYSIISVPPQFEFLAKTSQE